MKKLLKGILPGLLLISLATPGFAENRSGAVTLSPFVGGYLLDREQQEENRPIFGLRGGYNFTKHLGAEAMFGYSLTEKKEKFGSKETDLYRYGVDILYHFMPDSNFVPFIAVGGGGTNFNTPHTPSAKSHYAGLVNYGVGVKYFVADNVALRGDVRHVVLVKDTGDNNLEYSAGLTFQFGGKEKVAAIPVVCPPAPAPAPAPVPAPKAVEAPPAATTAALAVAPATVTKGQSAIINWKSENASGCEIQPGIGQVPSEGVRTITPAVSTTYNLTCAGAGGTATSTVSLTVVLPPPAPVRSKAAAAAKRFCNKPAVLEINFDTDKSDIKPQYHDELKTVGDFLMYFPNAKGEISGHSDSTASDEYNQKLSERRAESVEKYISTTFKINPGRITTKGYGESKPIASNKTKAGRAKNRRIVANFTCE